MTSPLLKPASSFDPSTAPLPHGWLVVDKPLGVTSAQVVARVKRWFSGGRRGKQALKIGHAGTLDPLASGILPLALGEATKTVQYVMDGRKTYRFTVTWGEERSTDDAEGEITAQSQAPHPTAEAITRLLPQFTGEILQMPPAFSAIKVAGERAYALARAGEAVALAARPVMIYSIDLEENNNDFATFRVECGKGTYVRALARDMGRALGCLGYVSVLRRLKVGKFDESHAILLDMPISLDFSSDAVHIPPPYDRVVSVASSLDDIPAWTVDETIAHRIRQGQPVPCTLPEGLRIARSPHNVVAVGEVRGNRFHATRVFNL